MVYIGGRARCLHSYGTRRPDAVDNIQNATVFPERISIRTEDREEKGLRGHLVKYLGTRSNDPRMDDFRISIATCAYHVDSRLAPMKLIIGMSKGR